MKHHHAIGILLAALTLFGSAPLSAQNTAPGGAASTATAQSVTPDFNPCASNQFPLAAILGELPAFLSENAPIKTHGLIPADFGMIVYDSNQGLCWLADANLAGDPEIQAKLGVTGINPDGTMFYATAVQFVNALNAYDHGHGYLGHNNWQLPVTPQNDGTCTSSKNVSFGASCKGSALGSLYYVGLNRTFPDSVVPQFTDRVWPFRNLQPSLYWASGMDSSGQVTFSFGTGANGSNTTKYNYYHVLPMAVGLIGPMPTGSGVVPYTKGAAASKAVYDTNTGISWVLDANLAAFNNFGVTGSTIIPPDAASGGSSLTAPLIDVDGAMLLATATQSGGWLAGLNESSYAGTNSWMLPSLVDMKALFQDVNLSTGNARLESERSAGPFQNFQPFFYWACMRDQNGTTQSPCDPSLSPTAITEYSFDFDNGFEGTDVATAGPAQKQLYVMVYYPAPAKPKY